MPRKKDVHPARFMPPLKFAYARCFYFTHNKNYDTRRSGNRPYFWALRSAALTELENIIFTSKLVITYPKDFLENVIFIFNIIH